MDYVEFFGNSYFLAWCSLWLFWMIVPIAAILFRMLNRIFRCMNIIFRGWPPGHLDADGDFVTAEDEEVENSTEKQDT